MSKELYSSKQISRAHQLLSLLAGHEFNPLSNKEIMARTGWDGVTTTRQCQAAQHDGFVEQTTDGLWRLAPRKMVNIAVAFTHSVQHAKSRFEDEVNNYSRSTH